MLGVGNAPVDDAVLYGREGEIFAAGEIAEANHDLNQHLLAEGRPLPELRLH